MNAKSIEKHAAARKLRKEGLSTRAIAAEVGVSPTTVKRWVRDVVLSLSQAKELRMIPQDRAENCLHCGDSIPEEKDGRQRFCNRSCAASYNNSVSPKRVKEVSLCPSCGKPKSKPSELCQDCRREADFESKSLLPMKNFIRGDKYAAIKFVEVRKHARQVLERQGREKKCEECGFDAYIETCHISPITDFPEDTPLCVVNSPDNLKYLCPNHHVMLDKRE